MEEYIVREIGRKLANKELHVLTLEDKKYNIAKNKFKEWRNSYKNEVRI